MQLFCVITADIIKSRTYLNSPEDINNKIYELNKKLKDDLVTSFTMSRGDEIQAVFENIQKLPKIIRNLRYYCRPFQLRIGIGIGDILEIDKCNKNISSWDMNGKAFYLARDSMDKLDKLEGKNNTAYQNGYPTTYLSSTNEELEIYINSIYILIDNIIKNWEDKHWQTIMTYEELGTYRSVAKELNISISAVQQRCKVANWKAIFSVEEKIERLLEILKNKGY